MMEKFLKRISSRKFLITLMVQAAIVVAIFVPEYEDRLTDAAVKVAGLISLVLASLGYGKVEGDIDKIRAGQQNKESDNG